MVVMLSLVPGVLKLDSSFLPVVPMVSPSSEKGKVDWPDFVD